MKKIISNVSSMKFWYDICIGEHSLKDIIPRLFNMLVGKNAFTRYGPKIVGIGENEAKKTFICLG